MENQREETYSVDVKLSEGDYCIFQTHYCQNMVTSKFVYGASAFFLSVFSANIFTDIINEMGNKYRDYIPEEVVFLAFAFVIFMLFLNFFNVFSREKIKDDEDLLFQPQTVHVDRAGLVSKGDLCSSSVKWKGIQKIIENDSAIYFFIGKSRAYIVPKRAFENEESVELFLKKVNSYWSAKTGKRIKNPWGKDKIEQQSELQVVS